MMNLNIPQQKLLDMHIDKEISKNQLAVIMKDQDDDMLQAHGGTYNCNACSYTKHVDCPAYC